MFNDWRLAADRARAVVTAGGCNITPVIDEFVKQLWERLAPAAIIDRYNTLAPSARAQVSGHLGVPSGQPCYGDVAGFPRRVVISALQYTEKRGTRMTTTSWASTS